MSQKGFGILEIAAWIIVGTFFVKVASLSDLSKKDCEALVSPTPTPTPTPTPNIEFKIPRR